jgi:hypothetical protein
MPILFLAQVTPEHLIPEGDFLKFAAYNALGQPTEVWEAPGKAALEAGTPRRTTVTTFDAAGRAHQASFISSNFAQQGAIKGGSRWLRVSIDDPRGVLAGVKLRPASGIYLTDAGPADLRIDVEDEEPDFVVGKWSRIGFSIVNVGQRPARATRVRVEADAAVEVKRRNVAVRPRIGPGDSVSSSFWVRPRDANPIRLGIVAEARTARAATEVLVNPSYARESASYVGPMSFLVALCGVALLAGGAFAANRRPGRE